MQFKQTYPKPLKGLFFLIVLALMCGPDIVAQTTYFHEGAKENILIERMEIKLGRDSVLNFSKNKPFSRKQMIPRLEALDSSNLSRVDRYNRYTALLNGLEWVIGDKSAFQSKKVVGKHFYKTPATLYEVNNPDFFLAVNPVIQYVISKESDNDQHLFLNTRGVSLRGRIANKIGFSAYITDNQERDPLYVQRFISDRDAVPGAGYFKDFKDPGGVDYFDARGSITFGVGNVIDVAFGFDKNHIGNGYRSLFLSEFSNSALFLKLNTRIWKFNYQNLFMELQQAKVRGGDALIPKKYAAMHHLDLAVTKWLNVGVFEGVVFGREDHFEFGYLNPVIFYRSIEQQNGSFDNALIGIDAKANVAKKFQFYSQFLLDEFNLKEVKTGDGWWANKWALQVGGKYIDAFGINNLDLQLEANRVRPFTYSHGDSIANYTHYNQPLAHPVGANFQEWIGIARYQPAPRWMIEVKAIYYKQGRDTGAINYGSNIFLPNTPPYRVGDYGFDLGVGVPVKTALANFFLSYEFKPNLFIEANALYRRQRSDAAILTAKNTFVMSAGIRWNMHRREFMF